MGRHCKASRGGFIVVWKAVLGVSLRELSYRAEVADVLETVATSWPIYTSTNIIKSPCVVFFLYPLDTPTRRLCFTCKHLGLSGSAVETPVCCYASTQPQVTYSRVRFQPIWRPGHYYVGYALMDEHKQAFSLQGSHGSHSSNLMHRFSSVSCIYKITKPETENAVNVA